MALRHFAGRVIPQTQKESRKLKKKAANSKRKPQTQTLTNSKKKVRPAGPHRNCASRLTQQQKV
jgi:hypothetical protein